ncbi:hypothetical protein K443DRAFT_105711, partial [Laccaria amethystina LaAM-08-1]
SLHKSVRLGMTRGTYNAGRGLFLCMAADLSVDIPSIDAQPYHLAVRKCVERGKFCHKYE